MRPLENILCDNPPNITKIWEYSPPSTLICRTSSTPPPYFSRGVMVFSPKSITTLRILHYMYTGLLQKCQSARPFKYVSERMDAHSTRTKKILYSLLFFLFVPGLRCGFLLVEIISPRPFHACVFSNFPHSKISSIYMQLSSSKPSRSE